MLSGDKRQGSAVHAGEQRLHRRTVDLVRWKMRFLPPLLFFRGHLLADEDDLRLIANNVEHFSALGVEAELMNPYIAY